MSKAVMPDLCTARKFQKIQKTVFFKFICFVKISTFYFKFERILLKLFDTSTFTVITDKTIFLLKKIGFAGKIFGLYVCRGGKKVGHQLSKVNQNDTK